MKIPSCTRVDTMDYYEDGEEDLIDQAALAEDIQYIFKQDVEKLLQNSNSQTFETYLETTPLPPPPLDSLLTLSTSPPKLLALVDFKLIRDVSDTLSPLRRLSST